MTDLLDFARIRELCDDYYQQRITKEEYRKQRTGILNKIDKEINDIDPPGQEGETEAGLVDKMMSFFRNSDEEKIL